MESTGMADTFEDKRDLPIFIHSELDDLGLTSKAFRVYAHLARRAGKNGAFPSYASMGKICFGPDLPDGQEDTWKKWAIQAVKELVDEGLIHKQIRTLAEGGNTSNVYSLSPRSKWKKAEGGDGGHLGGGMGGTPRGDGGYPKGTPLEGTPNTSFSDEKGTHPEPEQTPPTSVGPKTDNTKSSRKPKEVTPPPADPPLPTEHQKGFEAVCICAGLDYKVITKEQAGQVAQTWGILEKAGYTLDDLREFYRHWKYHDWRGKKGQFPTLSQLRAEIGKVKNLDKSVMNGNGNGNGNGSSMSRKVREL